MRAMVHRWIRGEDLVALLWILRQMLERSGSIEQFFLEGYEEEHEDVGPALDSFSTRALALDVRRAYGRRPRRPGVCYFFPRPSAGSDRQRVFEYRRRAAEHPMRRAASDALRRRARAALDHRNG